MRAKLAILTAAFALTAPVVVSAHAFGDVFALSLPFQYLAGGAAIALVYSFAAFIVFSTPDTTASATPARPLWRIPNAALYAAKFTGFCALAFAIVSGFIGIQTPTQNFASILFWVVLILGVTYASIFADGLYRLFNPVEFALRAVIKRGRIVYPPWLGYTPALVVYGCLIALELLTEGTGGIPLVVAWMLVGYLLYTTIAALLFGPEDWFRYGDFLNVFFGFIGRSAPLRITDTAVMMVSPAERLIYEWPQRFSALLFILFMLSSTSFDGLKETHIWSNVLALSPALSSHETLVDALVLLASPLIFFAVYTLAVYLCKILTRSEQPLPYLLLRFGYSLIPIAIAYNVAHYFTLLVTGVLSSVSLVSDPFGRGWDLFGTASYRLSTVTLGATQVWAIQIMVIILGHVAGTYVAHRISLREFASTRHAVIGQLPMLFLMVCYTVFGLWILSLPVAA